MAVRATLVLPPKVYTAGRTVLNTPSATTRWKFDAAFAYNPGAINAFARLAYRAVVTDPWLTFYETSNMNGQSGEVVDIRGMVLGATDGFSIEVSTLDSIIFGASAFVLQLS